MKITITTHDTHGVVVEIRSGGADWRWTTGLLHADARNDYPEALRRALRDYLARHLELKPMEVADGR